MAIFQQSDQQSLICSGSIMPKSYPHQVALQSDQPNPLFFQIQGKPHHQPQSLPQTALLYSQLSMANQICKLLTIYPSHNTPQPKYIEKKVKFMEKKAMYVEKKTKFVERCQGLISRTSLQNKRKSKGFLQDSCAIVFNLGAITFNREVGKRKLWRIDSQLEPKFGYALPCLAGPLRGSVVRSRQASRWGMTGPPQPSTGGLLTSLSIHSYPYLSTFIHILQVSSFDAVSLNLIANLALQSVMSSDLFVFSSSLGQGFLLDLPLIESDVNNSQASWRIYSVFACFEHSFWWRAQPFSYSFQQMSKYLCYELPVFQLSLFRLWSVPCYEIEHSA